MSKAFKCDRCKKCFDPWSPEETRDYGRISEYMCLTAPSTGYADYTYRDEEIHLCPDCNVAFGLFMENRRVGDIPQISEIIRQRDEAVRRSEEFKAQRDQSNVMMESFREKLRKLISQNMQTS